MDDLDDARGAGGKAPRETLRTRQQQQQQQQPRAASNSSFFALLRSPLQAAVNKVRLWSSPRDSAREQQQQQRALPECAAGPEAQDAPMDGTNHQPPEQRQQQQQPQAQESRPPHAIKALAAEILSQPAERPPPPPPPGPSSQRSILSQKQQDGWSPSKVQSLQFFLDSTAPAAAAPAACMALVDASAAPQAQRPYLGLKYLLRSGPAASGLPKTWKPLQAGSMEQKQPPAATRRYAPYALPPPGLPRTSARPEGGAGPSAPLELRVHGHGPLPLTPYPHAQLKAAAAAGQPLHKPAAMLRLPAPHAAPPLLPSPTAFRAAADPAPHLALTNGTPGLRPAQTPGLPASAQLHGTPMPRRLFQGSGLGSAFNTPRASGGGLKRGWDSGASTPLLESGSGIKRLTESKRQRYTGEAKSVLSIGAVSAAPTPAPRSLAVTPAAAEWEQTTPTTSASKPMPASTETARRILQSLDNTRQMGMQQQTAPGSELAAAKVGAPGSTPFPRSAGPPPPLDRLSPLQSPAPAPSPKLTPAQLSAQPPPSFTPLVAPAVLFTEAPGSTTPGSTASAALVTMQDAAPPPPPASAAAAKPSEPASSPAFTFAMQLGPAASSTPTTVARGAAPDGRAAQRRKGDAAPAPGSVSSARVYSFDGSGRDEVSRALAQGLDAVKPAANVSVPRFVFGGGAAEASKPASPAPAFAEPLLRVQQQGQDAWAQRQLLDQVAVAAAVPLPDDSDEEPSGTPLGNGAEAAEAALQPAPAPAAAAAGGWGEDFLAANKATLAASSDAVAKEVAAAQGGGAEAAKASAPAASGGWGSDFLAQNKSQLSAASEAVAQEVAKATEAPSGWGAAFMQQNQAQLGAASEAVAKEVEAARTAAAPTAGFVFGQPPADKPAAISFGAGDAVAKLGAAGTAAAAAAAAAAPVSSGGWDLGFLQKSQSAMATASTAVAKDIESSKAGGAEAAGSTTPAFAFGSPFAPAKMTTTPVDAPSVFGQPAFSFGATPATASKPADSAPAAAAMVFGAPPPAAAATAAPSTFTFGASSSGATMSALSFGSPLGAAGAAPAASSPSFAFGSSSTTATPAPQVSSFNFGAAAAATPAAPASAAPMFAFGAALQSAPAPAPAPGLFGMSSPAPSTSGFGATAAPSFLFGGAQQQQQQQQQQQASPSLFGSAAPASATMGFGVSSGPASAAPQPASTSFGFSFGAAAPPEPKQSGFPAQGFGMGAAAPPPFSQSPAAGGAFGNGPTQFGFSAPTPTPAGASSGFAFGSSSVAATPSPMGGASAWGAPSPSPAANTFGQPGSTPFAFGAAAPSPGFGASPSPGGFGAGQPAQQAQAPFGFGAGGFGGGAAAPGAGFGAAAPGAAPAFGMDAAPGGDAAGGGGGFTMGAAGDQGGRRKVRARRHGA